MELKKKTFVLIIVFVGILFLAFTWKLVYKHMYINSYKDIVLEEESHWYVDDLNVEVPYWVAVYDMEETEKKEKKYGILLPNIDFNDEMFVKPTLSRKKCVCLQNLNKIICVLYNKSQSDIYRQSVQKEFKRFFIFGF